MSFNQPVNQTKPEGDQAKGGRQARRKAVNLENQPEKMLVLEKEPALDRDVGFLNPRGTLDKTKLKVNTPRIAASADQAFRPIVWTFDPEEEEEILIPVRPDDVGAGQGIFYRDQPLRPEFHTHSSSHWEKEALRLNEG